MGTKWTRVTRRRKCKICGRDNWCGYTDDAAICMRVESSTPTKNGGWLHKTTGSFVPRYIPPSRPAIAERPPDLVGMWRNWTKRNSDVDGFAVSLGVDTDALKLIGCVWASSFNAWGFQMKDADGDLIGIRLRNGEGKKWSVKGSRSGLFIPTDYPFALDDTLYIVEGPTDLAAAMTLGLYSIGRAACLGQEPMIVGFITKRKIRRVVIVTDNDEPGLRGAVKLQAMLPIVSCIWVPPTKDLREFLLMGGTRKLIDASIKDLVWTNPARRAA